MIQISLSSSECAALKKHIAEIEANSTITQNVDLQGAFNKIKGVPVPQTSSFSTSSSTNIPACALSERRANVGSPVSYLAAQEAAFVRPLVTQSSLASNSKQTNKPLSAKIQDVSLSQKQPPDSRHKAGASRKRSRSNEGECESDELLTKRKEKSSRSLYSQRAARLPIFSLTKRPKLFAGSASLSSSKDESESEESAYESDNSTGRAFFCIKQFIFIIK